MHLRQQADNQFKTESEQLDFILDVLHLFSLDESDCYDSLFWRCEKPGTIEFFVHVNDVFLPAADLESISSKDLPAIRQAIADVRAATTQDLHVHEGFDLWVARKRQMRPLSCPKDERLRALFERCGPEREDEPV